MQYKYHSKIMQIKSTVCTNTQIDKTEKHKFPLRDSYTCLTKTGSETDRRATGNTK